MTVEPIVIKVPTPQAVKNWLSMIAQIPTVKKKRASRMNLKKARAKRWPK